MSYEQDRQQWRDEIERQKLIDSNASAEFCALHRSTVDFALGSIRGALLLNGGGAVAILSFMATSKIAQNADLLIALVLFVVGAVSASSAFGVSYISQGLFTDEIGKRRAHELYGDQEFSDRATKLHRFGFYGQISGCLLVFASLALFCFACFSAYHALQPNDPSHQTAHVVRVIDGDTLRVEVHGVEINLRLLGVDCPEMNSTGGPEAKAYVVSWLKQGKAINLEYGRRRYGKYGRLLAWVWRDGHLLQEDLIRNGHAEIKYIKKHDKHYARLQAAKSAE